MRHFSWVDKMIISLDQAVKTLWLPAQSERENPALNVAESPLSHGEKKHAAGLMRVNHAGEVCAQALYQGQALTADLAHVRECMEQAAQEEVDHLAWCEQRLVELASHRSYLNVVWYSGALMMGAVAGWVGDKWSLGFVVETERQVVDHLSKHIKLLPIADEKSKAILLAMREDEQQHAHTALDAGGKRLPEPLKKLMAVSSKVMTTTAYYF